METQTASPPAHFGEQVRRLLHRRELAATRHRAAVARSLGLSEKEMLAVGHLAQHGALAPATLASLLDLSSAGVTALVRRMEADGQLVREQNPADKRSILVRLTPTFARRAERAVAPLVGELQRLAEEVAADDRLGVARFLDRLVQATEDHADRIAHELGERGRSQPPLALPELWG